MLYTIGHGSHSKSEIIDVAKELDASIYDIRSIPYSKHNPELNKANWSEPFYFWCGNELGGFGVIKDEAIRRLNSLKENIILMCSELDPDKCHRKTVIARRYLEMFPDEVITHILWNKGEGATERN
ncbi:DUF488 domain-containing protein [bacterium]|nr:DUF488 domain-containing protein [bacterium]